MMQKVFQLKRACCLLTVVIFTLCLVLPIPSPAFAQSLGDYFSISYGAEFSKTQVEPGEGFYATITASATCINDLPVAPDEARITGSVVAIHQGDSSQITLNSSYTLNITHFPSHVDDTTQVSQTVLLQFPSGSPSGTYTIVGELIEAKIKVGVLEIPVTSYLPSSHTMDSVSCSSDELVIVMGGGGGGGISGLINLLEYITQDGRFTVNVAAKSGDKNVELFIPRGTVGKNRMGSMLANLCIQEMKERPVSPGNTEVIGLVYDIYPDGAVFDPPIIITFKYDDSVIPRGVAEKNLIISTWNEIDDKWVGLSSTIDPASNTISTEVSHLSLYTVMASTRPADFAVSNLSVAPVEAGIGESLSVSVMIANTGDLTGSHEVSFKINGVVLQTKEITLDGGDSKAINFSVTLDTAGEYTADINGLSGTFNVKTDMLQPSILTEPAPVPAAGPAPAVFAVSNLLIDPDKARPAETVQISAVVTNLGASVGSKTVILRIDGTEEDKREITVDAGKSETVTFTIAREAAGSYEVDVSGEVGQFVVAMPPAAEPVTEPAPPLLPILDWWPIIALIAGCVIIIGLVFMVRRRRAD